jgi:hypothetical protein
MLGGGLYLSLSLAIWPLLGAWALGVAAMPLVAVFAVFLARRELSDGLR